MLPHPILFRQHTVILMDACGLVGRKCVVAHRLLWDQFSNKAMDAVYGPYGYQDGRGENTWWGGLMRRMAISPKRLLSSGPYDYIDAVHVTFATIGGCASTCRLGYILHYQWPMSLSPLYHLMYQETAGEQLWMRRRMLSAK